MKRYTVDDTVRSLREIGVKAGDVLLCYSALFRLGQMESVDANNVPSTILAALLDAIGCNGTLVVPTYTFAFCRGEPFDVHETPSVGMGVFSEFVRKHPCAHRSPHPIQSVAALGRDAEFLCSIDTPSAYDSNGVFGHLLDLRAKVLLLGANIRSVSLFHFAEEQAAVPYRFWKQFSGPYKTDHGYEQRTYAFYVRPLDMVETLDMPQVFQILQKRSLAVGVRLGAGQVVGFPAREFVSSTMEILRNNPRALLSDWKRPRGMVW